MTEQRERSKAMNKSKSMKPAKRKQLEAAGFQIGSASDFLSLSKEEAAFVEMKMALGNQLRKQRERLNFTQGELAKKIGSSQSRVAKMEAADVSVSLDLLVRSLLSTGATQSDVAKTLLPGRKSPVDR